MIYFFSKFSKYVILDSDGTIFYIKRFLLLPKRLISFRRRFFFTFYGLHTYISLVHSHYDLSTSNVRARNPLLGERSNITRTFESMKKFYLRDFKYELYTYRHAFFAVNYNVFHLTFFQWYTYRYGFGKTLTTRLINFLGLKASTRLRDYFVIHFPHKKVKFLFSKSAHRLDDNVALFLHKHQRANISINCRKGLRLLAGLPCNGQRTRSNAKTSKKKNFFFDFKVQHPVRRALKRNPWIL